MPSFYGIASPTRTSCRTAGGETERSLADDVYVNVGMRTPRDALAKTPGVHSD